MAEGRRRPGRPGRAPVPGERVGLSLRVTPEVKASLDAAAASSGRSLSQEAEIRLERSFQNEELLPQLLDLAYGREIAGMLLLIGETLHRVATLGSIYTSVSPDAPLEPWMSDPSIFGQAQEAVRLLLAALNTAPKGSAVDPKLINDIRADLFEKLGLVQASLAVDTLLRGEEAFGARARRLAPARERLAHVLNVKRERLSRGG